MSKIKGLDSFKNKLKKLKDIDIKPIVESASARVRDEARKLAPVDTGELRLKIGYEVKESPKGILGTIFAHSPHALFIEFGTGPKGQDNHEGISPNASPIYTPTPWVYWSDKLNRFVYTKGQPARPFLYPAIHNNREKYKKYIISEVKKKIKEASK